MDMVIGEAEPRASGVGGAGAGRWEDNGRVLFSTRFISRYVYVKTRRSRWILSRFADGVTPHPSQPINHNIIVSYYEPAISEAL
jgi:hypothetical protein